MKKRTIIDRVLHQDIAWRIAFPVYIALGRRAPSNPFDIQRPVGVSWFHDWLWRFALRVMAS